jgi:hypothetical protein
LQASTQLGSLMAVRGAALPALLMLRESGSERY